MWKPLDKLSCFVAEFLAVMTLVFVGCMGCAPVEGESKSHLQIVFNFAFIVMCVFQIFGYISGAHLNPAVTTAAYISKIVTLPMAAVYIVAEFLGAFVGYGLLKAVLPSQVFAHDNSSGLCTTHPHPDIHPIQAVAIEFIITTVLIFFWCSAWDPRNSRHLGSACLKFGFVIAALALAAGPWSGSSMNPVRSLAPAVWNSDYKDLWVYFVGPMAAGILSPLIFRVVFAHRGSDEDEHHYRRKRPVDSLFSAEAKC